MVALAIISVGMLGFIGAFSYLSAAISNARFRTIASNLAQEKQESLKKISYYRLVVTTAPVYSTEPGVSTYAYDPAYYPSETLSVGGSTYIRRAYVEKVQNSPSGFVSVSPDQPDTGMKKITVYVMWQPGGAGPFWSQQVASLYSNPNRQALGATIQGNVTNLGGFPNLPGVHVECLQDTSFFDTTDASGNYNFSVTPGTYSLRASLYGYYTGYGGGFYVAANSTATQNMQLTKMSVGQADGVAWLNENPIISQVVGSSPTSVDQEWVEVFNPTTFTWLATDLGIKHYRPYYGATCSFAQDIAFDYTNTTIAPGGYFLFANLSTITYSGAPINADAYYDFAGNAAKSPAYFDHWNLPAGNLNIITVKGDGGGPVASGAIILYEKSTGDVLDVIGWSPGSNNPPPGCFNGTIITPAQGLQSNGQFVRIASTAGYSAAYGPAYDSEINSLDFVYNNPVSVAPHNTSSPAQTVISGSPAVGAVATSDDGLSTPAIAVGKTNAGGYEYAEFTIPNIATGTWMLSISSGTSYVEISSVAVLAGATTYVPNALTSPAWFGPANPYQVVLSSSGVNGFVSGHVYNAFSTPLSGIPMTAGGSNVSTLPDGSYILAVPAGLYTVTANPTTSASYNKNYVSYDSPNVNVVQGELTTGIDYHLSQGGAIGGWVTTNGTDPLPNVDVSAFDGGGNDRGDALSGSDGYFTIPNLSTGTFTVQPQLDRGETVTPSSPTVSVTLGNTVWASSFTVAGAFGTLTGAVTANGIPITTGVLVVATTGTIAGFPPNDTSSFRSGAVLYYATSSMSDGTFTLPVRGASSPGLAYNIYAWYTTWSGSSATVVLKTRATLVQEGATVPNQNLAW
jgi:hypothetical protein